MTPYLPDCYAMRLRLIASGAWRPTSRDPLPRPPVIVPPRLAPTTLCGVWWCCAYATRAVGSHPVCSAHHVNTGYRPPDVRGRYPAWMRLDVFNKNGTTRRAGPHAERRPQWGRYDPWSLRAS